MIKKKKKKKWKVVYSKGFMNDMERLFSNNPIYSIPRFFSNAKYEIKCAWQRVFRGYDDSWNWGLYQQLQTIIPKCVRWMKKNHLGCPGNLYDEKNKRDNCWKWKEILEKIAKGFEAKQKISDNYLFKGKRFEKLDKQQKEGMKLFVKYFNNLWD